MKAINIMNFVRCIDERFEDKENIQFEATARELSLVNEFGYENTFLLQYDVLCSDRYLKLFSENATERTELGLWYEIVEPLTSACGLPYRSENGWKWDWHIIPGFSMAYTVREREMLADEAMRKFRETFGYYPRTIASWVIDTHTVNYLCENYDIDAIAICRDQTSTDAYTLVGGYFNQAYYPSKYNVFTPAQTAENRVNTPVFRLLGPCPLHNYDMRKYLSDETNEWFGEGGCFTLEPVWKTGYTPECVDWFFKTYFENEDLGFSYAQLGQENSFAPCIDFIPALLMQFEKLQKRNDVTVAKMCDTGAYFKKNYVGKTPATTVFADDDWDKNSDAQSLYYDSENYVANLYRYDDTIFIRALYLFDERVKDLYLTEKCTTFDAIYENLPIVDTLIWNLPDKKRSGLVIDSARGSISVSREGESTAIARFDGGFVRFSESDITVRASGATLYVGSPTADIRITDTGLEYSYKGSIYFLDVFGADVEMTDGGYRFVSESGEFTIQPRRA